MGMFDDIETELPCQRCGATVTGFQSKSGPCMLAKLTPQQLFDEAGSGAVFYSTCIACKAWNQWTFKPPTEAEIIADPDFAVGSVRGGCAVKGTE